MAYSHTVGGERFHFPSLARLLAKATPARSGDELAGIAAESARERIAAQMALADLPIKEFLSEAVVAYESDEVTRLIQDSHDAEAFAAISHLTVGELRDFLLSDEATGEALDLAAYVVEALALALDPFPRKPGAVFVSPAPVGETSPFAALARLTRPPS